ncbi:MAG TPA: PadR family transcriptional regulator [Galbitalea sp.]
MSSIRIFILDALDNNGPMHGHQLRLLAEKEHVQEWTDITVGALYGAIKRLAAEGLIEELRQEREGAYPERQVFGITDPGRISLGVMREDALREIVIKPDPFDLAMSRLDRTRLDELDALLKARIGRLRAELDNYIAHTASIEKYLSFGESVVMQHMTERLRAEITWHEHLYQQLPAIIADESARKDY